MVRKDLRGEAHVEPRFQQLGEVKQNLLTEGGRNLPVYPPSQHYAEFPGGYPAEEPGTHSLLEYWYILRRQKWTILCFVLLGFFSAVLVSLLQPRVYRARTAIEVQDFNENFMNLKDADPTTESRDSSVSRSYFHTQIKVLQSRSLLERVMEKMKIQAPMRSGWRGYLASLKEALGSEGTNPIAVKDEALEQIEDSLTVRASGETRLVEVFYESPDAEQAAEFTNTLVEEFIVQSRELRWESTQRTGQWLANHLQELKVELESAEGKLQEYAQSSGLLFTGEKENVAEAKLRQLQDELSKAGAERVEKQATYELAVSQPAESLPEILDDETLRQHRIKLAGLRGELVELSASYTPTHYKVQQVQAQIAELQSLLERERQNIIKRISNEYQAARRREVLLARAYSAQANTVSVQASAAIRYNILKHEVETSRQLYDALLQRVKQAGLAAAMRGSNILVVDRAKPPLLPYRPNLKLNAAIGLACGLLLGLGFVVLRERMDRSIHAPGSTPHYLGVPELGVIPRVEFHPRRVVLLTSKGKDGKSGKITSLTKVASAAGNGELCALGDRARCLELATWNHRGSLLADSFRAVLTSVLLPRRSGSSPRVIVVTSPSPGEGKTTAATNLGIASAEIGRRVLLIDGDLRAPRLHGIFELPNKYGLKDLLHENQSLEQIPSSQFVLETRIPGLCLLPSGSGSVSISKALYSARMRELLARVRREFLMVLIDAPPILHLADARVLGRLADGVILVFRAGKTTAEIALMANQRFAEDGTTVLGSILNSWDPNFSDGYHYKEYEEYLHRGEK